MTKNKITEISVLLSDCYKFGHRVLYPENTTYVYSTLTPRENSYFPYSDKMVVFGYEMFVQRWLVEHFNENFFDLDIDTVVEQYHYVVSTSLGEQNADAGHIRALHELGYLPILIKALPEGTLAPMKVPVLTIENTHDDFAWLTNFLETLLISETFVTSTVASMALAMKKVAVKYGLETAETLDHIAYQCHDFSERGQHGNGAAQLSGIGHLTSFVGSDTIQAAVMAHNYYGADLAKENILKSVVASEHSVMQAYGVDEVHTYKTLMERHPDGILSLVSDTYDYYGVLTNVLPTLHKEVMARNGKVVIRPDSGNPVDIIAGVKAIDVSSVKPWEVDALLNIMIREIDINKPVLLVRNGNYSLAEVGISLVSNRLFIKSSKPHELTPEDKGSLELLWEQFGGTINSKGYKVLDPHVGLLYGEGITVDRMAEIFDRMKEKGFSSENVVFGVGAYVYSVQISRDSFAQAIKSQMVTIDGEDKMIFKNPKTDVNHVKRSLAGKVVVLEIEGKLVVESGYPKEYENPRDLLQPIFENGEVLRNTPFKVIRDRLDKEANSLG